MKKALILGASGGIGGAVAAALGERGISVTGLSRRDGLDVMKPETVDNLLSGLTGPFDLVIIAIGLLAPEGKSPEKSLAAIDARSMAEVFAVNAIGPALILRHVPRLLPRDRRGVVGVLSARVGSIGDNAIGGWHSYRASKAAVNQIVRGAAIELRRTHKQAVVAALHPGTVATRFTSRYAARHKTTPPEAAATRILAVLDDLQPRDTGTFRDYAGKAIVW